MAETVKRPINIVLVAGAAYGDEGKGNTVARICNRRNSFDSLNSGMNECAIVRYNGGAQAGHTVLMGSIRHVHQTYGSGTLLGYETYLARDFILDPIEVFKERERLLGIIVSPAKDKLLSPSSLTINPKCRVSTLVDRAVNNIVELERLHSVNGRHGSCGMGIYQTIQRNALGPDSVRFTADGEFPSDKDMIDYFKSIVDLKALKTNSAIQIYESVVSGGPIQKSREAFLRLHEVSNLAYEDVLGSYVSIIFEGAQGLLLDMDYEEGFPYLTPSHPGLFGAIQTIANIGTADINLHVFYVVRPYLTRHGDGPVPSGSIPISNEFLLLDDKTNVTNEHQGDLRGYLHSPGSIDLMVGAIERDLGRSFLSNALSQVPSVTTNIVVTGRSTKPDESDIYGARELSEIMVESLVNRKKIDFRMFNPILGDSRKREATFCVRASINHESIFNYGMSEIWSVVYQG